jgi:hypothetical protein
MTIPVVWFSYHDSPPRGYWDTTLLDWLFEQRMPGGYTFNHMLQFPDHEQGIVLVTPGHWRDATQLNEDIKGRPWVLLIVTSDEEGLAPIHQVQHPNLSVWKHTPRAELPWQPDRALPLGWTPGTVQVNQTRPEKVLDWFFAGQITHGRREEAATIMRTMNSGKLIETDGFTKGVDRQEYFDMMRRTKVVPCPSGPNIPDSFRFYEALESGAVPLADATCPRGDWGYWHRVFGQVPFPVVEDWQTMSALVAEYRGQAKRVEVLAWWEQAKRDLTWRLHDDLTNLGATRDKVWVTERITVLIPTSPIPSHPSTGIIEQTVKSVRRHLPQAEIIIMADGVRPELEHRREAYTEYLESLVWLCRQWRAVPLLFSEHQHQANMTRRALELVRTDLMLFVEHDTPLVGQIPWTELGHWILNDDFHVIRLHHEKHIPKEHMWLMRGRETLFKNGRDHKFEKTVQWSQRPHLARTDRYREWINQYFPVTSRTMIEDVMHGIVEKAEWEKFHIGIYTPGNDIQRSTHLDGRAGDSKFEELMHL